MHIILLILKIIGILLAVILGLLLLVLLLVLFVPLRYRLEGSREQSGGEICLKGRVSWLLPLLCMNFGYDKEPYFKLRLLGFLVKPGAEGKKEKKVEEAKEAERTKEAEEAGAERTSQTEPTVMPPKKDGGSPVLTAMEVTPEYETGEAAGPEDLSEASESFLRKIRNILLALWERLKRIPRGLRALQDRLSAVPAKISRSWERAGEWMDFFTSEEVKETLRLLRRQTKRLLHQILPRKVRLQGRFGFADPSLTGQVTGIISLIPAFYGKDVSVTPDFSEPCLEGEFFLKGRVRSAALLALGLKIWLDPSFKKAYKRYKKM